MNTRKSVSNLRRFVSRLVSDRVASREDWHLWRKQPGNEDFMAECLEYVREEGMPSITNLVLPFFHPRLPLIGLNYTNVAHVTLHQFQNGWTRPLRLCRGIVFDRRGTLVAFPFPKFFNFGEHRETMEIPDGPFEVMVKEDGHLAIIFSYKGKIVATTRGCFTSGSADIANRMLDSFRSAWAGSFPSRMTVLCELIHPETEVILDYAGREEFILLGAYSHTTFRDLDYCDLNALGRALGLKVVERWTGTSIAELTLVVKNEKFHNKEGFVVRFADRRIKFKYAGYIGRMIEEKLTARYVMLRLMEGKLDSKLSDLPFELKVSADAIVAQLMGVKDVGADKSERLKYLYGLVPADECTDYHKGICRRFHKWLVEEGKLPPEEKKTPRRSSVKKTGSKARAGK